MYQGNYLHLQYILFGLISIILVCLSYKGHAPNFLAKGYQLHKSMDIRYGIEKLSVIVLTLSALART